jgi:hypothetical protein
VRLSMLAAMLAFLPRRAIAEFCNEFDAAGRRDNGSATRALASVHAKVIRRLQ